MILGRSKNERLTDKNSPGKVRFALLPKRLSDERIVWLEWYIEESTWVEIGYGHDYKSVRRYQCKVTYTKIEM